MATRTTFLQLTLPANNEFFDTWDKVVNENFTKVEARAELHDIEIINARFSLPSLADFLAVSHNPDGTLQATGETVDARNSRIYGHKDSQGVYTLEKRIRFNDFETFYARRGTSTVKDGFALEQKNQILNGAKTALGQPNWLGFTANKARLDGSASAIDLLVYGQYQRIRALEEVAISGPAATYYVYAEYAPNGEIKVDGDSTTAPPVNANGVTGNDVNSDVRIFSDPTSDFTTFDVKAGDILRILGNTAVSGDYVIEEVAAESNNNYLRVTGLFADSLSALDYVIIDPLKCSLGFSADDSVATNRLYLGEADFDGAAVTAVRPRQFKDFYVGDWRAVDLSGAPTSFEETWSHYLGSEALDITVQVSIGDGAGGQPNGSQPVEHLSLGEYTDAVYSLLNSLSISNTLALSTGDQTLSGGVSLAGTLSLNKDSDGFEVRSVRAKHTKNQITVKNVVPNAFYTDYAGAAIQTGYIRVLVTRKEG